MKLIKLLVLIVSLTILSGCGSISFRFNSMNTVTAQQPVKTYTTLHNTIVNLDPWDLGLSFGGNWVHCRTHGFHDLNDWTDFRFSPYFCRPSHGFLSGSQWNSNWGGMNNWNPRFNYLGNTPHRWSPFGYDRWGYGGYNNWMGNVYYGNYNWYRGVNYFPGQNNWYRGRNVYRGRRATNRSGRWESTTPVRRVNTPTRTRTNTRPTRTTPTRTRTNTTPREIRPIRTNIPTRTNVRPTRTQPTRTNVRPTRTQPTRTNVRPTRTTTRPVRTQSTRTNARKQR